MLLKFDLRNYEQPVYETCYSDDDVNMILMNEKDQLLATCDDSGNKKMSSSTYSIFTQAKLVKYHTFVFQYNLLVSLHSFEQNCFDVIIS